jgi:hypothetical protein
MCRQRCSTQYTYSQTQHAERQPGAVVKYTREKPVDIEALVAAKLENWLAVPDFPRNWCDVMGIWVVGGMFYGFVVLELGIVLNYYAARDLSVLMFSSAVRNGPRGYTGCDIAGLLANMTWKNHQAVVYWPDRVHDVKMLAYVVRRGHTTQDARDAAALVLSAQGDQALVEWRNFEGQYVVVIRAEGRHNTGQNCWVRTAVFPFSFWYQRDRDYTDDDGKSLQGVTDVWSHPAKRGEKTLGDSGLVTRGEY